MSSSTARANQQSPLLDKNPSSSDSRPQHNMEEEPQQPAHPHPPRAYIIMVDLINMLMTSIEIALVLYLTVHHFEESMGVIAVAMLAPILLNFVGVTYFFSDKNERRLFEKVGTTRITKDMFQVPVLGPVFTAVKVLLISSGLSRGHNIEYERFEASAVKMRQAQTFFSAAPEAIIQLSVLLISRDDNKNLSTDKLVTKILEITVVVVSIFTLAESNVYALRSAYFRLFHTYEKGDWTVHETFGRKCILFFHSFFSIGSRVAASACLISGIQCLYTSMRDANMQRAMMSNMQAMVVPNSMRTLPRPSYRHLNRYDTWEDTPEPEIPEEPKISNTVAMMPVANPTMMMPGTGTEDFGYVIGLTLISLIVYHIVIYYVARLLRYSLLRKAVPGGCYRSINYGWRSTILHFGFQSKNVATQVWFYLENCAMFGIWWISIERSSNRILKENSQIPMTAIFTTFTLLSLFFLFAAVGTKLHRLRSPFKESLRPVSTIGGFE